ncbi:hypothetical protein MUTS16_54290 [Escherichia coli]|nr:hypothetical protein MUTS16_54290 [Escherichia coli]
MRAVPDVGNGDGGLFNAPDNARCTVVLFHLQEQRIAHYRAVEQPGRTDRIATHHVHFGMWIEDIDGIK